MSDTGWRPLASRLVAEFFVIVLGVLVALGVDEWREGQAEVRREIEYLESLAQDLERDIVEYEGARDFVAESVRGIDHLLHVIGGEQPSDPLPSLAEAVRRASWINYPAWTSGTLDELVTSGSIRLIRDPQLKRAILDYYESVEEWKPRILGAEFGTFIEYRRYTAGWLPPSMSAYSGNASAEESELDALDATLLPRVRGNRDLFALTSAMREDWSGIAAFMRRFAADASTLRGELETAASDMR